MLAAVCNDAVGRAAPDSTEATPRMQPLELQHGTPAQDGAVPLPAETLAAASPAECVDQHTSPAEAEAGQPVAAQGANEQQASLPAVDAPDAVSPAAFVDQCQSLAEAEAILPAAAEDSAEQQAVLPAVDAPDAASPAGHVDQHQGQAEAEASLPAAAGVAAEQQASLPAAETLVAASPAECFNQQQSLAEAEAVLPAAADSSAEQQEVVPVEAPDASGADSAGSSPRDAGPAADAPHAAPSSQDAAAFMEAAAAAAPEAARAGPQRRRQWRRVVVRREAAHAAPPGPTPASPLQLTPPHHSPAQLTGEQCDAQPDLVSLRCIDTIQPCGGAEQKQQMCCMCVSLLAGTTRAPGSPEPRVASASKRPRISPPPLAADAVHAPPTPEPQPWAAVSVPRMLQPAEALQLTAALSSGSDIAVEVPELRFADISTELQPDPAAPAVEDAAAETPRSAAAAADQPCHSSSVLVADGCRTAEEPQSPPFTVHACIGALLSNCCVVLHCCQDRCLMPHSTG
jgi:hypothetical protein